MSVGELPLECKHAIVTPDVHENGDASKAANYRPISLTCVACKLMERIIAKDVLHCIYVKKMSSATSNMAFYCVALPVSTS
jgi:hypothetical protein